MQFDIETARAVVQTGIDQHAWDKMPEHEVGIMDAANELVATSVTVSSQTDGEGKPKRPQIIKDILFLAKVDPVYKEECEARGVPYEHSAPAQEEAPVASAFEQPNTPPPDADFDINAIIPGYDDFKVKDLKPKIAALTNQADVDAVKTYEEENEARKGILEFEWTPPAPAKQESAPDGDVGLDVLYASGQVGIQTMLREGMAPPPEASGDYPDVLSIDISTISPQDLTRLSMAFQTRLSRTLLLASREEGKAKVAENLKHDARADAFQTSFSRLKGAIDKQTAAAVTEARQEAGREADMDDTYRLWRDRQVKHETEEATLKAVAKGFEGSIERLSREQSRREKIAQS
jgi:hypothetical protein